MRVTTRKAPNGTWVYPELLHNGTWHHFYDGNKALACLLSVDTKSRIMQVERDWTKWLTRWRRTERLRIPFYQKPVERLPVEVKKENNLAHHISLLQKRLNLPAETVAQLRAAKTKNQLNRILRVCLRRQKELAQLQRYRQTMVVPEPLDEDFDA